MLWREEDKMARRTVKNLKVIISRDGWVKCGVTYNFMKTCYQWRSDLACIGCPMQELMKRSKANRGAFSFDTTEELFEDDD